MMDEQTRQAYRLSQAQIKLDKLRELANWGLNKNYSLKPEAILKILDEK